MAASESLAPVTAVSVEVQGEANRLASNGSDEFNCNDIDTLIMSLDAMEYATSSEMLTQENLLAINKAVFTTPEIDNVNSAQQNRRKGARTKSNLSWDDATNKGALADKQITSHKADITKEPTAKPYSATQQPHYDATFTVPPVEPASNIHPSVGIELAPDDTAKRGGKKSVGKIPNYVSQCKIKLENYLGPAMRSLSDMIYMPLECDANFSSLEAVGQLYDFREAVWNCMSTLETHRKSVLVLEEIAFKCVLPLNRRVAGVLPDNLNFSTITPTRINNALKRSREEMLKNERENSLKKNVVDFLRPPKSYCLKQWPSMSATKQNSVLQPVFESFLLMRQDTSLRIHTYSDVNSLEDF